MIKSNCEGSLNCVCKKAESKAQTGHRSAAKTQIYSGVADSSQIQEGLSSRALSVGTGNRVEKVIVNDYIEMRQKKHVSYKTAGSKAQTRFVPVSKTLENPGIKLCLV
ncbi:hypothetical protein [Caldicellulosiruptor bescii]|uniref:hypothetical protein n=1 Tax=Caldicellulosiruptor bescii TaxID=31899 RepID=UPI0002F4AAE8|nr:hypothetical protein [Caldicellulosiruptor bescii]